MPTDAPVPAAAPTVERHDVDARQLRATVERLVACGTRHSLSSWSDPKRGIGCGRNVVAQRFREVSARSGKRLQVTVDGFETSAPRTDNRPVHLENVVAVLPGKDPSLSRTAVVVTGHFDSMPSSVMDPTADAPGADDDGSGTAVVVEAARLLAGRSFRATIVFAAVSGEEQGLLGSKRLVEWLRRAGYTAMTDFNNDIVGADPPPGAPHRIRLFSPSGGKDGLDAPARELARWLEELVGPDHVRRIDRLDRLGRGGDHASFIEAGFPAVRLCEPQEDYAHEHQTPRTEGGVRYGDTLDHLDFGFLSEVAWVNTTALASLGDAPAPPESVTISGAVSPAVTLSWTAAPDPQRIAVEVLWRETTDPRWSVLGTVRGPDAHARTFPGISTDNHFFAARSVGVSGQRSIAVPGMLAPRTAPGAPDAGR